MSTTKIFRNLLNAFFMFSVSSSSMELSYSRDMPEEEENADVAISNNLVTVSSPPPPLVYCLYPGPDAVVSADSGFEDADKKVFLEALDDEMLILILDFLPAADIATARLLCRKIARSGTAVFKKRIKAPIGLERVVSFQVENEVWSETFEAHLLARAMDTIADFFSYKNLNMSFSDGMDDWHDPDNQNEVDVAASYILKISKAARPLTLVKSILDALHAAVEKNDSAPITNLLEGLERDLNDRAVNNIACNSFLSQCYLHGIGLNQDKIRAVEVLSLLQFFNTQKEQESLPAVLALTYENRLSKARSELLNGKPAAYLELCRNHQIGLNDLEQDMYSSNLALGLIQNYTRPIPPFWTVEVQVALADSLATTPRAFLILDSNKWEATANIYARAGCFEKQLEYCKRVYDYYADSPHVAGWLEDIATELKKEGKTREANLLLLFIVEHYGCIDEMEPDPELLTTCIHTKGLALTRKIAEVWVSQDSFSIGDMQNVIKHYCQHGYIEEAQLFLERSTMVWQERMIESKNHIADAQRGASFDDAQ